MHKLFSMTLAIIVSLVFFASCSSDDEYTSAPPVFTGATATTLSGGSTIHAGDSVAVSAIQKTIGSNLGGRSYSWSSPTIDGIKKTTDDSEIRVNPSCKFKAPDQAGVYTITLVGIFKNAGTSMINVDGFNTSDETTTIKYERTSGSSVYGTYTVTISHKITVE